VQSRVRIGQELESSCFSGKGLTSDVETSHTSHLSFHDVHTDGDGSHVSSPRLETRLPWQDPTDTKYRADGKAIPRRTIFSVAKGCNCTYKYSGVAVKPYVEPDWLAEIREKCVDIAGLDEQPNSCNINLYRDGNDQVGWHTDDEPLFEGEYNDICILSLSLGSSRTFQLKKKGVKGVARNEATSSFVVSHGDLCTMEGRFQRHYLHAVLREPEVEEPRINLTWRFITKHNHDDGCTLHGPGN